MKLDILKNCIRIRTLNNQKGTAMLFITVLTIIASILLGSIFFTTRYSLKRSGNRRENVELLNIAEGGLNAALAKLRHSNVTLYEGQTSTLVPLTALGNGFYEVWYTDYIQGTSMKLLAKGMIGDNQKNIEALVDISCKGIEFNITNGQAIPLDSFSPTITILGAAVTYGAGGYNIPVTVEVKIGTNTYTPFGPIDLPVDGNVNDSKNPRIYSFLRSYPAGTPVSIRAKSWVKYSGKSGLRNSDWYLYREVRSSPDNGWIKVLRDGDSVPDLDGFASQADVETFIRAYVDSNSLRMNLGPNDAIYLIEFGSQTGAAADYQDCVILITLDGTPSNGGGCNS